MNAAEPADTPRRARRRARWIVLGVIGLIVMSAGAVFLDAWISAGKVIERERLRVADRTERFRNERPSFPNLFEPAEEGNAWEPFLAALKELEAFTTWDLDVFPSIAGDEVPEIDDEALGLMGVRLQPALEHLRRAFRGTEVESRTSYEGLAGQLDPSISGCIKLNRILADLAAHEHRWENDRDALELLAMGYWSGGIPCAKGCVLQELVRCVIGGILKDSLRKLLQEHGGSASDLRWFGESLDRLDKALPPLSVALHRDDLEVRQVYLQSVRDKKFPDLQGFKSLLGEKEKAGLRRFLPIRIQVAQWFQWKDGIEGEFDRIETLPLWERPQAAVRAFESAPEEPIPLMTAALSRVHRNWLINRREMSLARLAVAIAAYGAEKGTYPTVLGELVPGHVERIPLDPWNGKPFRYVCRVDSAILYSLGFDGDDDGGRPVSDDDMDEEDGDIVWTVKRREAARK